MHKQKQVFAQSRTMCPDRHKGKRLGRHKIGQVGRQRVIGLNAKSKRQSKSRIRS